MKIAVATQQGGLDDSVAPNFGRAPSFTFVDVEGGEITGHEVIANPHAEAPSGAGTQASQLIASQGAQVVLAGAFGPKASAVLAQAGVAAIPSSGPVRDRVLEAATSGPGPGGSGAGFPPPGSGWGGGPGGGRGRGGGYGRGGGGWGAGPGGGGWGAGPGPWPGPFPGAGAMPFPPMPPEIASLIERVNHLEEEVASLTRKLDKLSG